MEDESAKAIKKEGIWHVPSQSNPEKTYEAVLKANNASCTCADYLMRHRQCKHILVVLAMIEGRDPAVGIIPRKTIMNRKSSPQNIRKVVTNGDGYNPRYFADSSGGFDGTAQGWGYKSIEALKKAFWYSRHRSEFKHRENMARKFLKNNPEVRELLGQYFSEGNMLDSWKDGEELTLEGLIDEVRRENPSNAQEIIRLLEEAKPLWKYILGML